MDDRLRWASDQCPLPWSAIPSLHHTQWYATGHHDPQEYTSLPDGYTVTVFQSFLFSWYRSFSRYAPPRPPSRSLITLHEWLPKYHYRAKGWLCLGRPYTCAYAKLHPDYRRDWRQHARRHLRVFQRSGCTLRLGSTAEVENLYQTSQVPKAMQSALLRILYQHLKTHPETIDILIAEKNGQAIACLVAGNCQEANLSEYIIGAFHPHYKEHQAMVGLMDWWYQRSLSSGFSTLTFGHMETQTSYAPMAGNGYSVFKTHFGVTRMWMPKNHWRLWPYQK